MEQRLSPAARHRARRLALQALYQWHMNQGDLCEIEAQFRVAHESDNVDWTFFSALLHGVPQHLTQLDSVLLPLSSRPLKDVSPVELNVLRLGLFELQERIDVPYKTVINEYVDLVKVFGGEDGHKFVNKILDSAAQGLRSIEIDAQRGK